MKSEHIFFALGMGLIATGIICSFIDPTPLVEGDPTQFTEHPIAVAGFLLMFLSMSAFLAFAVGIRSKKEESSKIKQNYDDIK